MELLLASKSPRRRQLLGELQLPLKIIDIDVDESIDATTPVELIAQTIAQKKASAIDAKSLVQGQVLVSADTVVVLDNKVLGKPKDHAQARQMLQSLSEKCHTVYTGVCLKSCEKTILFTEATKVFFKSLTAEEIDFYITQYNPVDKAGSYGIQEWIGMIGVEKIEGCYYNVMGLPVARIYDNLKQFYTQI